MLLWWLQGRGPPSHISTLQLITCAGLLWSAAAGGGDDIWWEEEYEYFHFECFAVAALVCLAMVFDALHHRLVHIAKQHPHSIEDGEQQQVHHDNEVTLWESLLNQTSGELMVLGMIAFAVWTVNRAGLFDKLAKVIRSDTIRLPPGGYDLLHIVEDVHMQLFIAMLLYVSVLGLLARGTRHAEIAWEEANEHIVSAFEVGLDPMVLEGLDAKSMASLERFMKARIDFMVSLEQWRGSWDLLETELEPLLLLLRTRPGMCDPSSEPRFDKEKEDDVIILLKEWFPFDQYLSLQCRFLVSNLVQIKASTWGFFCATVLIKALLMRWLKNAEVRYVFDGVVFAAFLCFATAGTWQVAKQNDPCLGRQPAVKRANTGGGSLRIRESVVELCHRHSIAAKHLDDNMKGLRESEEREHESEGEFADSIAEDSDEPVKDDDDKQEEKRRFQSKESEDVDQRSVPLAPHRASTTQGLPTTRKSRTLTSLDDVARQAPERQNPDSERNFGTSSMGASSYRTSAFTSSMPADSAPRPELAKKAKSTHDLARRPSNVSRMGTRSVSFAEPGSHDQPKRRRSSVLQKPPTIAEVKEIAQEKVRILKEHKDYPWMTALTLLQIMLFSISLTLVRFIANVHWWQETLARTSICGACVVIGAPMFGIMLGRWIPGLSMALARTEFMQARNVHWVSVLLEDHVTGRDEHCRASSRRHVSQKKRRASKESADADGTESGGYVGARSLKSQKSVEAIVKVASRTLGSIMQSVTEKGWKATGPGHLSGEGMFPVSLACPGKRDIVRPSLHTIASIESEVEATSRVLNEDAHKATHPADSTDDSVKALPGTNHIDADID